MYGKIMACSKGRVVPRLLLYAVLLCAGGFSRAADDTANRVEPLVTILVYHRFSDTADDSMTVRMNTFKSQLHVLREHGYHIVALRAVVDWLRDPDATLPHKPVAITVDDGHRSVFEKLLPVMLSEHFPVTLFIYPSAISNASYALTWEQLRTLKQTGLIEIQSHTYWHPNFNIERRRLAPADFRQFVHLQLDESRRRIESQTGATVDMLAWPFGLYDDELITLAANEGYIAAFSLEAKKADRHARLLALPRYLMIDTYDANTFARLLGEPNTPSLTVPGSAR